MQATKYLSATTSPGPAIPTMVGIILTTMMAAWPWAVASLWTAQEPLGRPRLTSLFISVGHQESQGPNLKSHSFFF